MTFFNTKKTTQYYGITQINKNKFHLLLINNSFRCLLTMQDLLQ